MSKLKVLILFCYWFILWNAIKDVDHKLKKWNKKVKEKFFNINDAEI